MTRSARVVLVSVAAIAPILVTVAAWPGRKRPPCPAGRFLVKNTKLVAGEQGREPDVIVPAQADRLVSIPGICPAVRGTFKVLRQDTRVTATFAQCAGLPSGRVRLRAKILAGCNVMTGMLKPRRRSAIRFEAVRSTCGDGFHDAAGGEQCDGGNGCPPSETCTERCTCEGEPTTTTVTIAPSTIGQSTSTSIMPTTTSTTSTLPGCQAPTITSVDPLMGSVGTEVTITGTNLDCGSTHDLTLNGIPLTITSITSTEIKTFIPIGGEDGRFTFTTDGGTVTTPEQLAYDVTLSNDFSVTVAPTEGKVIQGSSSSYSVQVNTVGGRPFTGLANLELGGLRAGINATLSSPTLTGGQQGMLTVTAAADAPLGSFELTLTATGSIDAKTVTKTTHFAVSVMQGNRTALLGQFMLKTGTPMPRVSLKLISHTDGSILAGTTTDDAGNFLFLDPPAGVVTLSVDTTPFDPTRPFPIYGIDVTIVARQATVVGPFKITPPPPSDAFTRIDNSAHDQVISKPNYPGASITLPAGAVVTGWDGVVKNKITILKLAPDELPMPPPPGLTRSLYQFNFGTSMGGVPSVPLPVTVPNDQGADPGEKVDLWYYDAAPLVGAQGVWRRAGTGTVSQDGTRVVSDPGVGIERFCGVCGTTCMIRRQISQAARNLFSKWAADPVDIVLGQQIEEHTDLVLPGRLPAIIHRTYNPEDPFGIKGFTLGLGPGWALSVDIVLLEASPTQQRIILPGNARADFPMQGPGMFINTDNPVFAGAALTAEASGTFRLRFKNGGVWRFIPHPNPQLAGTRLLAAQIDRNGNSLTIERDAAGNITALRTPSGRALDFSYSGNRISRITDPLGRMVTYGYSGGRLQTVTDPAGGVTTYTYDPAARIVSIKDARDTTYVTNHYGSDGRLLRQTLPDGGSWKFEYIRPPSSTIGPITGCQVTNPGGDATTYRFTGTGFTGSVIDAAGQVTTLDYDAHGQVVTATDPIGRVTRLEYDGAGNVTKLIDPENNVQAFEYDPTFSNVTKLTDPAGSVTTFEYDGNGNLVAVTDPEQNLKPPEQRRRTTIAYNSAGQPLSVADPLGDVVTLTYDADGNLATISDALGNTTRRLYDPASRMVAQIDRRGRTTKINYDALNRVSQLVDATGGITEVTYDANGNVVAVRDTRGMTTSYAYDSMDRLVTTTDALGQSETFGYDLNGALNKFTDRSGRMSVFEYDSIGQPAHSSYSDGSFTTYDFDAVGRLVRLTDSTSGGALFGYDDLDRLTTFTAPSGSVEYGYDVNGRRVAMRPAGLVPVTYRYDANSRVREVVRGSDRVLLDYDELNRRRQLLRPNGVSTEYAYDARSRLLELIYRHNGNTLGNLAYQYDAAGNVRGVAGTLAGTLLPGPVASASYDAANRQLQFGKTTMTYDSNGNLASIDDGQGVTKFAWDARDQLTGINGPGLIAAFAYDSLGRRASSQINGRGATYAYDGVAILSAKSNGRAVTYLGGLWPDDVWARNSSEFPIADSLGTVIALTDASGAITDRYSYEPFGRSRIQGTSDNTLQFTGRENDGTGLYYYRARYYSPELHRFISEDPLGLAAGDINYYAYVSNSPLSTPDPLGLKPSDPWCVDEEVPDYIDEAAKLAEIGGLGLETLEKTAKGIEKLGAKAEAARDLKPWLESVAQRLASAGHVAKNVGPSLELGHHGLHGLSLVLTYLRTANYLRNGQYFHAYAQATRDTYSLWLSGYLTRWLPKGPVQGVAGLGVSEIAERGWDAYTTGIGYLYCYGATGLQKANELFH